MPSEEEVLAYRALLPLSLYFSTEQAIPRFHYTVPNQRALEIAERYGLKAAGPAAEYNISMRRGLCADVVTLCPVPDETWQAELTDAVLSPMMMRWRESLVQLRDELRAVTAWHVVPSFAVLDAQSTAEGLAAVGTFDVKKRVILRDWTDDDKIALSYVRRPFLAYGANEGLTVSGSIDPKGYRTLVKSISDLWNGVTHSLD